MAASNFIPVGDLMVWEACCCGFTAISCKYPECCGISGAYTCMCCKGAQHLCKLMDERANEEKRVFLCQEGAFYCVKPTTCVAQKQQCCCLDTRCAMPPTPDIPCMCTCLPCCTVYPKVACCKKISEIVPEVQAAEAAAAGKPKQGDLSDTPIEEVRVIEACCCTICGLFCQFPKCIGGKVEGKCLCCNCERSCCKPITEQNEDGICCICCDGGQYIVIPTTCTEVVYTFCGIDYRCAFPCTEKVPCMFTCLPGCVVCVKNEVKFGCCTQVKNLVANRTVEVM